MKKILALVLAGCLLWSQAAFAALTKTTESTDDWTAVAQNVVIEGTTLDTSDHYSTELHIQAFLDSTTAHTGTEFIVQVSGNSTGDEDWEDYTRFVAMIDTANSENISDNPLAATSTTITMADTGGEYETAPFAHWIAIEDSTLINSELVLQKGFTLNTNITIVDGTTNSHVQNTTMYDIAISRTVTVGFPVHRCRVIVNNTFDADGSTINFKVRAVAVTGI